MKAARRRPNFQPFSIIAYTVLWCLLWGEFTPGNVASGIILGVLVLFFFPMPPLGTAITFRPVAFAHLTLRFCWDLVRASLEVSVYALDPRSLPRSSVIAIPLRSRSDLFLTLTGDLLSLVPGSLIVEAQRSTGTLYLHVLEVTSEEDIAKARKSVWAQEERLLRALAPRQELKEAGLI